MSEDTHTTIIPCPYVLGATFKLEISPPHGDPFVAEAKVTHVFSPFTMSSAMKVALTPQSDSTALPSEAVLKVYDRRFADDMREQEGLVPATYEGEAQYAQYLASEDVAKTEDEVYELMDQIPEGDPNPLTLDEHLAAFIIKSFFESETTVYPILSDLQGKHIPTFYGTTRFVDGSATLDTTVPGILIEFIPGTSLSNIDPANTDLDAVCSTAMDIVYTCGDRNILNQDVRLGNFIVKPNGSEVVMIDFGDCRLRREDEDDQAWGEARWDEDEPGAVGCVAHTKFGWSYSQSLSRSKRYVNFDLDLYTSKLDDLAAANL
ncbi:unnamed protein product [Rhizoctonia solani]|uniref:Protein kinase domain-containing protein n=1 Tax=Rhizoctonia solani TaxID=456999 RepID=A0A8H3I041_9AGAM|nr:unnamed protein product [Rhizoctonia solani]